MELDHTHVTEKDLENMTHDTHTGDSQGNIDSLKPTKKIMAAAITGLLVFLITKLGLQVDPVLEQALNVVTMLVVAYFVPNDPTPGGVPE